MTVSVGLPRKPTTVAIADRENDIKAAVIEDLKSVKASADGWQKGLAGMLALLTSVLFLKGKESIDGLTQRWQYVAAGLLVAAAWLAVASAYMALTAANGSPAEKDLEDARRNGLFWMQFQRAQAAAVNLDRAKKALILALAFIASTVLITWFAPGPGTNPAYWIQHTNGNCGQLEAADNGQLKLVSDANVNPSVVPLSELNKLTIVAKCP
jgi:hypothetical protein